MNTGKFNYVLLGITLAFASACGGGGDDGSSSIRDDVIPPPGEIIIPPTTDLNCDTGSGSVDVNIDTDGDGLTDCDEILVFSTNPDLRDTDGDSFSDAAEVAIFDPQNSRVRFNPLISDLARIAVDLTSVPQIELSFTDSNQTTTTVATSHDQSISSGVSSSRGGESTRQLEIGHTVSTSLTNTVGVEVMAGTSGFGATASYEVSLSVGLEASRTQTLGSSVNWTSEQRSENSRTFSESEELSRTSGTVFNGGTLRVTARVRNNGFIAYDLENLTLSAFIFDPARPFAMEPVGTLTFSNGSFPATSITTNSQSAPLNFSLDLTLPQARRLLRDSSNLVIAPSTFRLLDSDSRSILLRDQDVAAQTATITIDFGRQNARLESHRVAINRGGGSRSISALEALRSVLGFQVSEGPGSWVFGNEGSARNTPTGLLSIDGIEMSSGSNRYWYGALNQSGATSSGGRSTEILNLLNSGYELGNIALRAGDTLSFVYIVDTDRDALPDRFEDEFGTNPDLADSDNDTLLDAAEIYGTDLSAPPCSLDGNVLATSNPLQMDSDGDGVNDATEIANCENPNFLVIADAGIDQTVNTGMSVTLSGGAEGMFSGQPEFTWRLMNGPDLQVNGSPVRTLSGIAPTFTAPDEVSTLVFELGVTVEGGTSNDQVIVQVQRDRSRAVYVGSNTAGSPNGSQNSPFNTLEEAVFSLTPGENQDLYVMTRRDNGDVLPYLLVNTLELPDGSSVYGGYNEEWIRNTDAWRTPVTLTASATNTAVQSVFSYSTLSRSVQVSGFALTTDTGSATSSNNLVALAVIGTGSGQLLVENNTLIAGNVATGASATPGSSYGAYFQGLALLQMRNNQIVAGNGGLGAAGSNGGGGVNGNPGRNGNSSSGAGGRGGSGTAGANGGAGGAGGGAPFGSGSAGARGTDIGSRRGGAGGAGGNPARGGRAGGSGSNGAAGSSAAPFDSLAALFTASTGGNGVLGTNGTGGGGGGGGNGRDISAGGGAGGGGGESGTTGRAGTGAIGGGASIGVWISDIPVANIRDNRITTANAGNGGLGGAGGRGGSGGRGGNGILGFCNIFNVCGSGGGGGGRGGSGGRGGDGSGGNGGPSIGLFVGQNMAPIVADNSLIIGNGGIGGGRGNSGAGGDSVAIFDADINDGRQPNANGNSIMRGQPGSSGGVGTSSGSAGRSGCAGDANCS